jgi:hypothetical protein
MQMEAGVSLEKLSPEKSYWIIRGGYKHGRFGDFWDRKWGAVLETSASSDTVTVKALTGYFSSEFRSLIAQEVLKLKPDCRCIEWFDADGNKYHQDVTRFRKA